MSSEDDELAEKEQTNGGTDMQGENFLEIKSNELEIVEKKNKLSYHYLFLFSNIQVVERYMRQILYDSRSDV